MEVALRPVTRGNVRALFPVGILFVVTERQVPYLVRFMITRERQRSGIGRPAVELLAHELLGAGYTELEVSFVAVEGGAEGFWRRCGFTDAGHQNSFGERIFRRQLEI